MSRFDTALIAAITSAVVALAIEWAAKPRLEARKDRILEYAKARREILLQLSLITMSAASLNADISELDSAERRKLLSVLDEQRASVVAASGTIQQALAVVGFKTRPQIREVIARTIGLTRGIAISEKLREQAAAELMAVSSLALDLYHAPRWRFLYRRKLLARARQVYGPGNLLSSP